MIAKGNLHGNGGLLANYLITGDEHEIAELVETRGLEYFGRDPVEAFEALQKVADTHTQCWKPFFHVQTRNPDGDKKLTTAEWLQIADREEKRLGFDGQPRIVSFHIEKDTDEKHMHIAWCRIDLEMMRAIDPGLFKNNLKQLCRKLEWEYGLQEVSSTRKPEDIARIADRKEVEEARRLGMDVRDVRNTILDCLGRTDNGKAFRAALDEHGMVLSNGDRRDCFVVIDPAGGHHALNKKLTGLTLAAMRDRLGDLDRTQLPNVEQAKAMQQEKYPTPEQAREAWDLSQDRLRNMAGRYDPLRPESAPQQQEARPRDAKQQDDRPEARHPSYAPEPEKPATEKRVNPTVENIGFAWRQSPTAEAFAAAMKDEGYKLASVTPQEARDSERAAAVARENGSFAPKYRENEIVVVNERGAVYRLNPKTTGADRDSIDERLSGIDRDALPSMGNAKAAQIADRQQQNADHAKEQRETRWQQRDETKLEKRIGEIEKEAAKPGGKSVAAGLYAEGITLARVDKAGKAYVEHEYLRQFENAKLQDIREGTNNAKLRPASFKEGEIVAVTKWGSVHRLNPRFIDAEKLERDVTGGSNKTPTLSAAREHFATERQQQKDDRATAREIIKEAGQTQRGQDRVADGLKGALGEGIGDVKDVGLKVVNTLGKVMSLASFVESLFGFGSAPHSPGQQQHAPQGGQSHEPEAMEAIYESMQRGEHLNASDIRNLSPETLMNIRSHGDDHVLGMIRDFEIEKEQETAQEWAQYYHDRMGREL